MKKTIASLTVILVISLLLWGVETSFAKVTGRCDGCHTMHNSQDGADLNVLPAGILLLKDGCVGCHSHLTETQTYTLGTSTVPVVNSGVNPESSHLAAGNFYWVAQGNDAMGHNVYGISGQDSQITPDEGAPGNTQTDGECQTGGCHGTLATAEVSAAVLAEYDGFRTGCEGCHLNVRHHAEDGSESKKYVNTADQGWYRFLAGHGGQGVLNIGVEGIEDNDWQLTLSDIDHNEYLGVPVDKTGTTTLENGSMTAFCCGCHGNFHVQNTTAATTSGSQSPWIRHPSDFVIPSLTGEYASMSATYSTLSPVARPGGFTWVSSDASNGNVLAGDMVMCLSCHRAHGSPYNDLLRWDYSTMDAGGGGADVGCFYCHTTKND
ncbi:MAG: hypothetical protein KAI50_14050 [Desulfobacterales bacterium]|nr:hypothetical protein [Desulfobacterales bacterium]